MPDLSYELKYKKLGHTCVGADEVGRGCLAGPVVAAAVILPAEIVNAGGLTDFWVDLDDSKKITHAKRAFLSKKIHETCQVQISWCMPDEIDRINILHASMLAMRNALAKFSGQAQVALIDGHLSPYADIFLNRLPGNNPFPTVETVIKGDGKVLSIAAASIVAKVYRDEWMSRLDTEYPGYGFAKHKGYSTAVHLKALTELGPCKIHRMSFAPMNNGAQETIDLGL